MKLTIEARAGVPLVKAYSPAGIRIDDQLYDGSVVVTAAQVIEPWPPRSVDELTTGHLDQAIVAQPEVLLIGTGRLQRFPSRDLLAVLYGYGIGFEIMDTGAACRTYNVLVMEGRVTAAALILER